MDVKVVKSVSLSNYSDTRFVVVNAETGEIVDDAQGYGYKTIQGAYKAWAYKTRDRSKDAEKKKRQQQIKSFLKEHKGLADAIEMASWDAVHDGVDFDSNTVKQILKSMGIETEFKPSEILKVWEKL